MQSTSGKFANNIYVIMQNPNPESVDTTEFEPTPKLRGAVKKGVRLNRDTNNNKKDINNIKDTKTTTEKEKKIVVVDTSIY